ncbi:MAG: hypothetical protein ACFHU9_02250 [Fluviicola sp.]
MEKIKTILDRKQLSSEYIRSKQDFANVVKGAKGLGKPYWQTNWFYGTVGVAAVAIVVTAVTLSSSDSPEKQPHNKNLVAMTEAESLDETPDLEERQVASENQLTVEETETSNEISEADEVPEIPDAKPEVEIPTEEEEKSPTVAARTVDEKEEEETKVEIGLPNVAGVTEGPIDFKDFCDPLGIQVGGGVLIYQYTLQYRSCARDITARIRGNRLPPEVCEEIRDCGSAIEVTFSNFIAQDREGNPVKLKEFSLVTRP